MDCFTEQLTHLTISGSSVAHMKLDGLPWTEEISRRHLTRLGIDSRHVPHQEISLPTTTLVFADDPADVQSLLYKLFI